MRKSSVLILALAIAGVLIAALPFGGPGLRRTYTYPSTLSARCASPVVSAWRTEPASNGGWFGYAPLAMQQVSDYPPGLHMAMVPAGPGSCREPARQRLAVGCVLVAAGVLVGFFRRRRFNPPANPNPNLAT